MARTGSELSLESFAATHLAVVHVAATGLTPAAFADSNMLNVGDIVLAIGNPLGLRSSVTQGIIRALGRTESEGGGIVLPNVIQTSAEINPGNSGGALVDIEGRVVGIPTLTALNPENGGAAPGIGFAIPSNTVTEIANQLIKFGHIVNSGRAYLGVRVATLPGNRGVYVAAVIAHSAAAKAGIRRGDVIVSVAGQPTRTADDLGTALAHLRPGQATLVKLTEQGKRGACV